MVVTFLIMVLSYPSEAADSPERRANGHIAQLVEQRTENPCVAGSIPALSTYYRRGNKSSEFQNVA